MGCREGRGWESEVGRARRGRPAQLDNAKLCRAIVVRLTAVLEVVDVEVGQTVVDVASEGAALADSQLVDELWHELRCPPDDESLPHRHLTAVRCPSSHLNITVVIIIIFITGSEVHRN